MTKPRATWRDKELGLVIRALRKSKGFSSVKLGTIMGMTGQQITKYERGENRLSVFYFIDICKVLKVNPTKILKQFM